MAILVGFAAQGAGLDSCLVVVLETETRGHLYQRAQLDPRITDFEARYPRNPSPLSSWAWATNPPDWGFFLSRRLRLTFLPSFLRVFALFLPSTTMDPQGVEERMRQTWKYRTNQLLEKVVRHAS